MAWCSGTSLYLQALHNHRFQPKARCRDAEESAEIFASRQENASIRGKTVRDAEKTRQISASRIYSIVHQVRRVAPWCKGDLAGRFLKVQNGRHVRKILSIHVILDIGVIGIMLTLSLVHVSPECRFNACRDRKAPETKSDGRPDKTVLEHLRVQVIHRPGLYVQERDNGPSLESIPGFSEHASHPFFLKWTWSRSWIRIELRRHGDRQFQHRATSKEQPMTVGNAMRCGDCKIRILLYQSTHLHAAAISGARYCLSLQFKRGA